MSTNTSIGKKPAGTLIAIGGKENKSGHLAVLARVIRQAGKPKPVVCLVTLATESPGKLENLYRHAFGTSVKELSVIHYKRASMADKPENLQKVSDCDVVFFSGGDQLKLCRLITGTELLQLIQNRYRSEADFVVAGTSAGAAALPDQMIFRGNSRDALLHGSTQITSGLRFVSDIIIDTHFIARGRVGRLVKAVILRTGNLGVGLAENTAVVIGGDGTCEVVGSGIAVLVDGSGITFPAGSLPAISSVRNIHLHILAAGERFRLGKKGPFPAQSFN